MPRIFIDSVGAMLDSPRNIENIGKTRFILKNTIILNFKYIVFDAVIIFRVSTASHVSTDHQSSLRA